MRNSTIRNSLLSAASILALLLVWKLLAVYWNQELIMPSPETTLVTMWQVIQADNFWPSVGYTLARGLLGFVISCAIGVVAGFAAGFSPPVMWLLQPWVTVIRTIPVMSVIILATACLGVVDERRLGHAFEEALPFTALLVVFFAVVAVIHDQHLLRPIFGLVLEIAFEGLNRSTRHKSGVAMRFPRVSRIRWDKPAREANTIDDVMDLLDAIESGGGRIAKA